MRFEYANSIREQPILYPNSFSGTWVKMSKIQIINENQEFNDLNFASKWGLGDKGFDYHVIAVFGSQSTGKSTLLNALFGTEFDVMNMASGRSQTTKGLWLSLSKNDTLVMDVEGTDGRERGEDQDFERKSALFSLATAEVVIINMWENAVGLYHGANMSLLKTVLEVNLQLFQKDSKSKTMLYFVLRDSTGEAPLATLSTTLIQDLEKAWSELNKPAGNEGGKIADYFDFRFQQVAHKVYASEKFQKDVLKIQHDFTEKGPDYVFKPNYHKGIPMDGFPLFAKSIWQKIVDEKDLDLPSQTQLLAQYRCDEISKLVFEKFMGEIKHIKPTLETSMVVPAFGKTIRLATNHALELFDKDASRYHDSTFQSKRKEFQSRLLSTLHVFYLQQLRNLHKKCILDFNILLKKKLPTDKNFAANLDQCYKEIISNFKSEAEGSKIIDSDWSYDEYLQNLIKDLDEICDARRKEALGRVSKLVQHTIKNNMAEPTLLALTDAKLELWADTLTLLRKCMHEAKTILMEKLINLGIEQEQVNFEVQAMKFTCWETLVTVIKGELTDSHLVEKLRQRFEKIFRYDERGLPRIWQPSDDIDKYFSEAKSKVS